MHFRLPVVSALAAMLLSQACLPLGAAEPAFQPAEIRVPEGFVVELAAAPPLVEHPMMAGFDERGRLFIAESGGKNMNFDDLLKDPPNLIRMLEDTDGDGRFDRGTVFADKMTFPMGAVWHQGALFVCSPPSVWRLEDTDGDGVADRREEIVSKFGSSGNAADVHGCFLGPEGRLYWCDGRHGHEFEAKDGKPASKGLAARVFSCRPDGSDIEVFCGGGMDNPVEVAFTADGEMLGTMTFYNPDDVRHDALVHFVYGGVYPRKHACVAEFKRTGDFLPPLSLYDTVAPAGLARCRSLRLGEGYRDNFFSVHFNTHKVLRHVLERDGASFRSADSDFLVSPSPDFHPTDVLEDADGSLLVIDTGGWFRIGCPTSQIAKPEVLGAIYRVRRADAGQVADPRGLTLTWDKAPVAELVERLRHGYPAVAERAIEELAARGTEAVAVLERFAVNDSGTAGRRNAVWALARIGTPAAKVALRKVLVAEDPAVRLAAVRSAGSLRDRGAVNALCSIAANDLPQIRREAATSLGRIGQPAAVPAILESLRTADDPFLAHALIYALIEIDDPSATEAGLADAAPQVRRAALIALDQMDPLAGGAGQLTRDRVAPLLDTDDVPLQQTVLEVIGKRPGWGDEILDLLGQWLDEPEATPERPAMIRGALLAFRANPAVQALVAERLARSDAPAASRLLLLEVIERSELDPLPAAWAEPLERCLAGGDPEVLGQALAAVAAIGPERFHARLASLAADENVSRELRAKAVEALARGGAPLNAAAFGLLAEQLGEETAAMERVAAAEALSLAALDKPQFLEVARLAATAGPLELRPLVRAFQKSHDAEAGVALVHALAGSAALTSLTASGLAEVLADYPGDVRDAAQPLLDRLQAVVLEQRGRLAELEQSLDEGDASRGRQVFFGKKTACSACHRLAGEGGHVGPDLSKVGQIRTRRDLLESVVFPSSSFARGYESFSISTRSGQIHAGIVVRETADAIYVRTAERAELRLPRAEIDELAPSTVSIMPQGLDKTMSPGDLADLLAFLQTLK